MGIFLSQPNLEKVTLEGKSKDLNIDSVGVSMQGWRNNQEDAEILRIPLDDPDSCLFAVFDGHGSDIISKFSAAYLPDILLKNKNYQEGNQEVALKESFYRIDEVMQTKKGKRILFKNILLKEENKTYLPSNVDFDEIVNLNQNDVIDCAILLEDQVIQKFTKLPEFLSQKEIIDENPSLYHNDIDTLLKLSLSNCGGCTANVGLIKKGKIQVANAGDSRAVARLKDGSTLPLSFDHKPDNVQEKKRIETAGGFVSDNRVNANLNLSRALGDFVYKLDSKRSVEKQLVIALPEIISVDTSNIDFVILGCDGIQDCVSNKELTDWFNDALEEQTTGMFTYTPRKNKDLKHNNNIIPEPVKDIKLKHLVYKFLDSICAQETVNSSGTDNMTCILVWFR